MALVQGLNERVVQVNVGVVFIAGGHAVAGDNRAVHHFRGADDGGQASFGVHAVHPGVVHQSLGLKHVHIGDFGQAGVSGHGFGQGGELVAGNLVGLGAFALAGQVMGCFQAGNAAGFFRFMKFYVVARGEHDHQVAGGGKRGVRRAGTGHVHDAFLRGHQAAGGEHRHAFEHQGLAFADGVHAADETGENLIAAAQLATGLDGVLYRHDAHAFAGVGQIEADCRQSFVFQKKRLKFLFIDGKSALFHLCRVAEAELLDGDLMQFQFHSCLQVGCVEKRTVVPRVLCRGVQVVR